MKHIWLTWITGTVNLEVNLVYARRPPAPPRASFTVSEQFVQELLTRHELIGLPYRQLTSLVIFFINNYLCPAVAFETV